MPRFIQTPPYCSPWPKFCKPLRFIENDGTIAGRSAVKLSALKIPDPSIAVASVSDTANLYFSVRVK